MNRRTLFGNTLKTTIALSSLSIFAQAQVLPDPKPTDPECPTLKSNPQINSEISSNHGHELKISYEDVISGKEQTILIKGKSGQPHHVLITADVLLALRTTQIVEVDSTTDAGHSHIVRITREPV